MKTLKNFKAEQMKDPAFAAAYTETEPEMNIIRAIVNTRFAHHLTQQELAKKPVLPKQKSVELKMAVEILL